MLCSSTSLSIHCNSSNSLNTNIGNPFQAAKYCLIITCSKLYKKKKKKEKADLNIPNKRPNQPTLEACKLENQKKEAHVQRTNLKSPSA